MVSGSRFQIWKDVRVVVTWRCFMDSNIVLWLVFFLNFYVLPTCVGCLAGWLAGLYLFIYLFWFSGWQGSFGYWFCIIWRWQWKQRIGMVWRLVFFHTVHVVCFMFIDLAHSLFAIYYASVLWIKSNVIYKLQFCVFQMFTVITYNKSMIKSILISDFNNNVLWLWIHKKNRFFKSNYCILIINW